MTQNIERVLERGQRLEELMDKTTDLEANVSQRALNVMGNLTIDTHAERVQPVLQPCDHGLLPFGPKVTPEYSMVIMCSIFGGRSYIYFGFIV